MLGFEPGLAACTALYLPYHLFSPGLILLLLLEGEFSFALKSGVPIALHLLHSLDTKSLSPPAPRRHLPPCLPALAPDLPSCELQLGPARLCHGHPQASQACVCTVSGSTQCRASVARAAAAWGSENEIDFSKITVKAAPDAVSTSQLGSSRSLHLHLSVARAQKRCFKFLNLSSSHHFSRSVRPFSFPSPFWYYHSPIISDTVLCTLVLIVSLYPTTDPIGLLAPSPQ